MSRTKVGTTKEHLITQVNENFNDFLELCFPSAETEQRQIRLENHDYLEKGIRIEDLARKKKHKTILACYGQKERNIFQISTKGKERWQYFQSALEKMIRELKLMAAKAKSEEAFLLQVLPLLKVELGIYAEEIMIIPEKENWNPLLILAPC